MSESASGIITQVDWYLGFGVHSCTGSGIAEKTYNCPNGVVSTIPSTHVARMRAYSVTCIAIGVKLAL